MIFPPVPSLVFILVGMASLRYEDLEEARVGQPFEIPAGTKVQSMHPQGRRTVVTKRKQSVVPHFVDQYVRRVTPGNHETALIVVTWAGTGGYWKSIKAERFLEGE